VKEDVLYQTTFMNSSTFVRYRCNNCREIFVVLDCGEISSHYNKEKGANVGGKKCENCGV
jgi:hypothetical protein